MGVGGWGGRGGLKQQAKWKARVSPSLSLSLSAVVSLTEYEDGDGKTSEGNAKEWG